MSEDLVHKKLPRKAMILAAGFGKRLHPLTLTTPKPLVPLNGIPFLERVLRKIEPLNLDRIVINTHYRAEQISTFIDAHPVAPITLSHEAEILETGGGIANALPFLGEGPFFTINSDIWWEESEGKSSIFHQLAEEWDPNQMDGLLAIVSRENALFHEHKGDFHRDEDGRLVMRDKNNPHDHPPYIYTGIQLIHSRLVAGRTGSYPLGHCFAEACKGQRLYGLELQGKWCDSGTIQSLNQLEEYLGKLT